MANRLCIDPKGEAFMMWIPYLYCLVLCHVNKFNSIKDLDKIVTNFREIQPFDLYFKDLLDMNILKKDLLMTKLHTKDHDELLASQSWIKMIRMNQYFFFNYHSS